MAIARIPDEPTKATPSIDEKRAAVFINGASKKAAPRQSTRTVVNMKFDTVLLEKIDDAATQRGFSRTAWVHYAASEILKRGME